MYARYTCGWHDLCTRAMVYMADASRIDASRVACTRAHMCRARVPVCTYSAGILMDVGQLQMFAIMLRVVLLRPWRVCIFIVSLHTVVSDAAVRHLSISTRTNVYLSLVHMTFAVLQQIQTHTGSHLCCVRAPALAPCSTHACTAPLMDW